VPACLEAFRTARALGVRPVFAPASIEEVRHSFCPVGRDSVIVSPDGRVAACYMLERDWRAYGLDLALGQINASGELAISQGALDRVRALTGHAPRCQGCLARWHCAGGCYVGQSAADRARPENPFCVTTRLISVCELLRRLGRPEAASRLLRDRSALRAVALRVSDRLSEWNQSRV
jgi:uncharacterized protein